MAQEPSTLQSDDTPPGAPPGDDPDAPKGDPAGYGDRIQRGLMWLVLPPVALMLLVCGPIAFAWETVEMLLLCGATEATIQRSEGINAERKASYSRIEFSYTVDGVEYSSARLGPGFLSRGEFTKGDRVSESYVPGQRVRIHYNPLAPGHATLMWGWFKGTLILCTFPLLFLGPTAVASLLGADAITRAECSCYFFLWVLPAFFTPAVVHPLWVLPFIPPPILLHVLMYRFRRSRAQTNRSPA